MGSTPDSAAPDGGCWPTRYRRNADAPSVLTYAANVAETPFDDPKTQGETVDLLNRLYARYTEQQASETGPVTIPAEVASAVLRRAAHTRDGQTVVHQGEGNELALDDALRLVADADDISMTEDHGCLRVVVGDEQHRFNIDAPLAGI
jgi:hypothetical protein